MLTHPMARMVTNAKIVHCAGDFKGIWGLFKLRA